MGGPFRRWTTAMGVLLSLVGSVAAGWAESAPLGAEGAAILEAPSIEVFRITPITGGQVVPPEQKFGGYAIVARSGPLKMERNSLLAAVVRDPQTFAGYGSGCGIVPDYALRLTRGDSSVEMLVSFKCDMFVASVRGPKGDVVKSALSRFNNRPSWVRQLKEVFPSDPHTQALSEIRPTGPTPPAKP